MKAYISFFCVLCSLFITKAYADDYVIKCKGYIDTQNGQTVKKVFIYVRGSFISKISKTHSPVGKKIIDLSDYYILPGLIDSHAHLLMTQTIEDKSFENALLREAQLDDNFRLTRAKSFLIQYLQEGFTTILDLGNSGYFLDAKLRDRIKNDFQYPALLISGPGIASHKGQFEKSATLDLVKKEYSLVSPETHLDNILKEYVDRHVDILKIYLDNSPGIGGIDETSLKNLLANKYLKKFKKITFHSISPEGALLIQKYNLKSIEHFNFYTGQSKLNSILFATPTDLTQKALIEFNYYTPVEYLAQKYRTHTLKKSSIKILFGPDFYFHSNRANFDRAKYVKSSIDAFKEAGLSSVEIIQSMTINPALSLNLEKLIGQVKVGNYANLIATKENPLEKIETLKNIQFVMNRGRIIINNKHLEKAELKDQHNP